MVKDILDLASTSTYDFRRTAYPNDPLKHLFEEQIPYYRLKWAIARVLQPRRILEIGVRFGYSAAAFLDACPDAAYLGIDNDSSNCGGQQGAIHWARRITGHAKAEYLIADSQQFEQLPGGAYDLIHIDGQQDGAGSINDLRKAFKQARHILVDGYFWTRDNFLHISELLYRYRDLTESYIIIPGYAGELLITPHPGVSIPNHISSSAELSSAYTSFYYLRDCGGFDAYKRWKGAELADWRLQSIADLAHTAPIGRAVDLGCGRGELSVNLAGIGHEVLAVDYSESAIAMARDAGLSAGRPNIIFFCGDVKNAPLSGLYDLVVASDLIEHMMPDELDHLYRRVATHLSRDGLFVIHTFPNAWYYKYEHPRRRREAGKLGAYIPLDPRSRYEELMHINEQSPRVLKRQLCSHFRHLLLWFSDHDLANPFENLKRPFRRNEMRAAGDLFALASHSPIDVKALLVELDTLGMNPVPVPVPLVLDAVNVPSEIQMGSRFSARIRLTNRSGIELKSRPPNPIHASYHYYSKERKIIIFDGLRTRIPVLRPGATVDFSMDMEAPPAEGTFLCRLTLVQEFVRWFDVSPQNLFAEEWIKVTPGPQF